MRPDLAVACAAGSDLGPKGLGYTNTSLVRRQK